MLTKLFECSEFFVSAEKCRRLAIGGSICGNEQSYENKNEKIFINQDIYKIIKNNLIKLL